MRIFDDISNNNYNLSELQRCVEGLCVWWDSCLWQWVEYDTYDACIMTTVLTITLESDCGDMSTCNSHHF